VTFHFTTLAAIHYYGCMSGHCSQENLTRKWDEVFAFRGVPIGEFYLR